MADTMPRSEAFLLIDMMRELWSQLDRLIFNEFDDAIAMSSLPDDEQLRILTTRSLLQYTSEAMSNAGRETCDHMSSMTDFALWKSADICAHRFLHRSSTCFVMFTLTFHSMLQRHGGSRGYRPRDYHRFLQTQIANLQHMIQTLVNGRILDTGPSEDVSCCLDDMGFDCFEDHFQAPDELFWEPDQQQLGKQIPLPSLPEIEFRDFNYSLLPQDKIPRDSVPSLVNAVRMSVKHAKLTMPNFFSKMTQGDAWDYEENIEKQNFPHALATVTEALFRHRDDFNHHIQLGIILPGGSQVLWPNKLIKEPSQSLDSVYVKAEYSWEYIKPRHCMPYWGTKLKFRAVKTTSRPKNATLTQTVAFVNLPPEIRNIVYGYILDDEKKVDGLRRQPRMALTCQLVNKEIMSLVFQRYGWFVKV